MGTTFIFTVVILSVLGLLLAVVLFLVAKKFQVVEDPLIDVVEATMPGANCGGCGFAGCRAFAEACVKSKSLDGKFCPVGGNAVMQKVAAHLGVAMEEKAPMVAVVRCNGTCANRVRTNEYDGSSSCGKVQRYLCQQGAHQRVRRLLLLPYHEHPLQRRHSVPVRLSGLRGL